MVSETLRNKQKMYEQALIQYFDDEFKFLVGVYAKRWPRRDDFTDKLIHLFSSVLKIVAGGLSFGAQFIAGPAGKVLNVSGDLINLPLDLIENAHNSKQIKKLGPLTSVQYKMNEYQQMMAILKCAAHIASYRYINQLSRIHRESIEIFAQRGVERVLEYFTRMSIGPTAHTFTIDNFLQGLRHGRSGRYKSDWKNLHLKMENPKLDTDWNAEGAYSKSLVMCISGSFKKKQVHYTLYKCTRSSDAFTKKYDLETKKINDQAYIIPKYGYMYCSTSDAKEIASSEMFSIENTYSTEQLDLFKKISIIDPLTPLIFLPVKYSAISEYLKLKRQDPKNNYLSFNQFIINHFGLQTDLNDFTAFCCIDKPSIFIDLKGGIFSKTDFSGSNLKHATLQGADFSESYMQLVNFNHADLSNATLNKVHAEFSSFFNSNCYGASIIQSYVSGIDGRWIKLDRSKTLGTRWENCNLDHMNENYDQKCEGLETIHYHAIRGDLQSMQVMITKKPTEAIRSANNPNKDKPLHFAVENGHIDIVRYLLEQCHVDSNGYDEIPGGYVQGCEARYTPLYLASKNNFPEIVELLKKNNVIMTILSPEGHSILHFPAYYGYLDVIQKIFDQVQPNVIDSFINIPTKSGFTPLHCSLFTNQTAVSILLLEMRANLAAKTTTQLLNSIHFIAFRNNETMANEILNRISPQDRDILINDRAVNNLSPAHIAAYYGSSEILNKLLSHNINVRNYSTSGYLPIHYSIQNGHINETIMLLNFDPALKDASLFANNEDASPLHIAAYYGRADIVKILLLAHANYERRKLPSFQNLVYVASQNVQEKTILSGNIIFENDTNPAALAIQNRFIEIIRIFLVNRLLTENDIYTAVQYDDTEIINLIIDRFPLAKDLPRKSDGYFPLQITCLFGNIEIAKYLLDRGANIFARNIKTNGNVLHRASANPQPELLNIFLMKMFQENKSELENMLTEQEKSGAQLEIQRTPLQIAAQNGHTQCVIILLQFSINLEDTTLNNIEEEKQGESPLSLAIKNKHKDVVRILLLAGTIPTPYQINLANNTDNEIAAIIRKAVELLVEYTFKFNSHNNYNSVHIAGTFNAWLKNRNGKIYGRHSFWKMEQDENSREWRLKKLLQKRNYEFKYVPNNGEHQWESDPNLPISSDDKNNNSCLSLLQI